MAADDKLPPTNGELVTQQALAALRGRYADWLLSALLGIFMAFIVGVLKWDYEGPRFRYPYNLLSLLGVWLLCFWAISLTRKILTQPR